MISEPYVCVPSCSVEGVPYENVRKEKHNDFFCFVSDFDKTDRYHRPIIEEHYQAYLELIYVLSGELKCTISKNTLIGVAGDLFVIAPGEVHSFERKKGCKYVCIQVDLPFIFSGILSPVEFKYLLPFNNTSMLATTHLFKAEEIDGTDIPKHIKSIHSENEKRDRLYRLSIRTSLSFVCLYILKKWESITTENSPQNEKLAKLAPVLEVVNREYSNNIKATDMAKLVNMSNSYFSRYFSATVGMGFTEYLNFVRIHEAERLLVSTDDTVAEISYNVGFSNASYFITQFKRQFQTSPKKYRQRYSNK
ncbi:MAG: helix-turn-helix transcriptional regulator [Clostridiales bacterium]|nr:helix-turn-helix transcriptional regulator [Clostridiales bacterium]